MKSFCLKSFLSLGCFIFILTSLAVPAKSATPLKWITEDCFDANGIDETGIMAMTGMCITAPNLICPSLFYGCPDLSHHPNTTGWATATPGDPNCVQPDLTYTDHYIANSPCFVEIHRIWKASYNDPNTNPWLYSECTQIIILEDTSSPVIVNCPANISIPLDGNCQGIATWTLPTATDNCGIQSLVSTHPSGYDFPLGTTTVTYTAYDACGLTATCSFTVTVTGACCQDMPSIVCPPNIDACVGLDLNPSSTGFATGSVPNPICPTPLITYTDAVISDGPCLGAIEFNRTWKATNPNNTSLFVTCVQNIKVSDFIPPIITDCPDSIVVTIPPSDTSAVVNWNDPNATDNCNLLSWLSNYSPGDTFYLGDTPVEYSATDDCFNVTECNFNVRVVHAVCATPPVITCPANVVACIGADTSAVANGYATAVAGDPNCDPPVVTYKDHILVDGPCPGRLFIRRIWTATDPNDSTLLTTCIQTINIRDNDAPVISNCPSDIGVSGVGAGCSAVATWSPPTATDNCGIASFTSTHNPGDSFPDGTTTVTYTATDHCGQVTTCSFDIVVFCQTCIDPPVITCPADINGCPGTNTDPSSTGYATAVAGSTYCGTPVVTYIDNVSNPSNNCTGATTIQRIWTATDPNHSNLTVSCVQTIHLNDTTAPVFSNIPNDITIQLNGMYCSTPVQWIAPTANDNCGIASLTSNYPIGTTFMEGTTTVTYTAVDHCGNTSIISFNVIIECMGCSMPPIISCPPNVEGCVGDDYSPATTGYATAFQSGVDGVHCQNPIITYIDNFHIVGPCAGRVFIYRTWIALNPNDNSLYSTCVQTINYRDTQAPVLSNCPQDITVTADGYNCTAVATWNTPTITDDCGVQSLTSNYQSGQSFPEGTTMVSYLGVDNCGQMATCNFYVTVECLGCITPPIIDCPDDVIACPGLDISPANLGYAIAMSGSGSCNQPILSYIDDTISVGPCAGAITLDRIWIATDPEKAKLFTACVQLIELNDTEVPKLTSCPADITVQAPYGTCDVSVGWNAPSANDNCGIQSLTSTHNSGAMFSQGTTSVIYTATDNCGLTASCSFNVTVECGCGQAPIISCPPNVFSCPGGDTSPATNGYATAVSGGSQCGTPTVTWTDATVSTNGSCIEIHRTWKATDPNDSSLFATCVQILSFNDTTVPSFTNCPSDIIVSGSGGTGCSAPASWGTISATDDCSIPVLSISHASGSTFPEGTTTVSYTATDACGNVAVCSFDVIVDCNSSSCVVPTISCPADGSTCPGSDTSPTTFGYATATPGGSNCGTPIVTYSDAIIGSGNCHSIQRTWIAKDPNDPTLVSTCVQTINVIDNSPPSFVYCPTDIIVNASGSNCSKAVSWNAVSATDNCNLPNLSSNYNSGAVFPQGTTTVIYTATDDCGNTASCSFDVTVICNALCTVPPTITCPGNAAVCIGGSIDPATTGYATAVGGANCPTPTVSYTDILMNTGPCAGQKEYKRIWTATYPGYSNLTASCEQWISVIDDIDPVFWDCPANITASSNPVTWLPPVLTDNCTTYNVTSTHNPGDTFPTGTTTVTYTGTDACGNVTHCSFTVTIGGGGNSPNYTCPDDIVVGCDGNGGAQVSWQLPSYTGSCGGCTSNYIPGFVYMGTFNGHQYYCSTSPATWQSAQSICSSNGGYLACIGSGAENAFLANQLTIQSAYIGLSDHITEGVFAWTSGEPLNYTNWYPNQPNNTNNDQHYCEMLSNGQWNDTYTASSLEFIMEIPCHSVTQVSGPENGSYLQPGNYTVEYYYSNTCGENYTCSFDITVNASLSLTCPQSAVLTCPYNSNGIIVNWDTPIANSCCSAGCNTGGPINGYIYMGQYNGSHYYCSLAPASWANASAAAQNLGGTLACIDDAGENAFLANQLINQTAYIGLSDYQSEGNFQWSCGTPLGYTNWYPNQPNDYGGNQDYVEMLSNGQWNDTYPSEILEYIVEIPGCLTVTQIDGPPSGSFFLKGTTTTITYQATDGCGNITSCSFDITIDGDDCDSGGMNSDVAYINKVGFNDLWHTSGNDGGYADHTAHCANISPGQSYHIYLEPGFGTAVKNVFWKIWIDFNNDGDYTDAGEYVGYGDGSTAVAGVITMPNLLWNVTTTMRVVMKCGGYPTSPCVTFDYGETEDYCVVVTGGDLVPDGDEVSNRSSLAAVQLFGESRTNIEPTASIYPNPAKGFFNLELSDEEGIETIEMIDVTGRNVKTIDTNNYRRVTLEGMRAGNYILSVRYNDGRKLNKPLIVID